jgi:two-component system OmpR family response regulator/two-component system response regulator RstA
MDQILLVEDDKKLCKLLWEYLTNHGFKVTVETRGDKAVYLILNGCFSLVILDVNLPEIDGLTVCGLVRENYPGLILMLTAREADDDHIRGLELGADDYINKPIEAKVLLARINTLLKRAKSNAVMNDQLIFGKLIINLKKREVFLNSRQIELQPGEFDLLKLLAMNAGTGLTRNNITLALRGIDYDGVDRMIDLRISYLRKKLDDNIESPFRIKTIRGKGYVFQPDAWD